MEEQQLNEGKPGQGYGDVKCEAPSLEESFKEQSENLDQNEQHDGNYNDEINISQAIDEKEKNKISNDSKKTEEHDLVASQVEEEVEDIADKDKSNSNINPENQQNDEEGEEMQQEQHSSDKKEDENSDNQESEIQEEEGGEEDDHQSSMSKPNTAPKIEEEEIKQALFLENFIREYQHQQQLKESEGKTSTGGLGNNNSEKLLAEGPIITAQQETQILQLLMEQIKYQQQQNSQQKQESEQNGENESNSNKNEGAEEEDEAMREEEQDEEINEKEAEDKEVENEDEDEEESQQQKQNKQYLLEKQLQNEKLNIAGYQQLEEETVMALINEANKLQAYLSNPQLTDEQKMIAEQKQAACLLQLKKLQQLIQAESLNPALLLQTLSASKQEQQSKVLEQQQHLFQNSTANNSAFKNEQQSHQNYQNHPLVNFFNSYSLFINDTSNVQLDQEIVLNKLVENATKCKPPSKQLFFEKK